MNEYQIPNQRAARVLPALALVLVLAALLLAPPALAVHGGAVAGTVVDPAGLLPPPGTVVRLLAPDQVVVGQVAVDPASGAFALAAVPNGNYVLRAVPPAASGLTPSLPRPVAVVGAPVHAGSLALTRPAIVGSVWAPGGLAPVEAWIAIRAGTRLIDTVPAPGGQIRIGGLPEGAYRLQAHPAGADPYWLSEPLSVTVSAGLSQTVSLKLTPALVTGRALDAAGNPVSEAVARVLDAEGQVLHLDLTAANGSFAIGDLPAGSYRLSLTPPWWRAGLIPPAAVPFSLPPAVDLGEVRFLTSNKIVLGRVETNTAQPVAGALIAAHRLDTHGRVEALSGSDGRYALGLTEGLWSLDVEPVTGTVPPHWLYPSGPQLVHFQHDASDETRTVNFQVLIADSHIVGQVQMPGGGAPPFTVTVQASTDAGASRRQKIEPGSGTFDLAVPHGGYQVTLVPADPGYAGPAVAPIQVLPNSSHDLGSLTLLERNATLGGLVTGGGEPLAEVPVTAWRQEAPDAARGLSGPDGAYVLAVAKGTWLVEPAPRPDQPWLYAGQPAEVEVADGAAVTGVDFELLATDATIRGHLVDEEGRPVTATRGWVHATSTADPAVQKGAPVEEGQFAILVPAGTYRVSLQLPPDAPWLAAPARQVAVESGGTAQVVLTLRPRNAAIAGALWETRREQTVTGVPAEVMGWSEGAWQRTAVFPGNGTYRLAVAPGVWGLAYRVDPASDYVEMRGVRAYAVAAGQTVPAPLPVARKDSQLAGMVLDPAGQPLPGAATWADGLGEMDGVSLGAVAGEDGRFALRLPHGHYLVRAALPAGNRWLQPASPVAVAPEGGTAQVTLRFRQPDAAVTGQVSLAGGPDRAGTAHLWAYSLHDGYTRGQAALGGPYALDVISNTTWVVGGAFQEGQQYWRASVRVHVPAGGAVQDLELAGPFVLPAPLTVQFDAGSEQYVALGDGTNIYLPAGALPVSGTVTLHVTPIATLPHQRHANVYRYGYAFTAFDAAGRPIEQRFNQDVLITFGYDEAELLAQGITEAWLKPAYFSTTTNSWTFPQGYVVDTAANRVAMQIDHFTDFGLTAADGYRVFVPLVLRVSN